MSRSQVFVDIWAFLKAERKYWLIPIVIMFILLGLVMVVSQSSPIAPFIYTLF